MGGEVLLEAGGSVGDAGLHVAIESGDDGADVFAADGFIVSVGVRPEGVLGLAVEQLGFKGNASHEAAAGGEFLEIVEMAAKEEVAAGSAVE